jgi:ketosteroid isomerase-like protein
MRCLLLTAAVICLTSASVFAQSTARPSSAGIKTDEEFLAWVKKDAAVADAAWNKRDMSTMLSFYDEKSIHFFRGEERGLQAIKNGLETAWNTRNSRDSVTEVSDAHMSGDMAWAAGTWKATISTPQNDALPLKGYWVTVYARVGDQWINRFEMENIVPPSPPSPPKQQ